jgi:hypothetical protein
MKTIKTLTIGLAVMAMMSVTNVLASFEVIGSPTGDWTQGIQENGVGTFTSILVDWVSGSQLQNPGLSSFSVVGWSQVAGNSSAALASGISTTDITFDLNILGSSSIPSTFDLYAYDGTTTVDSAQAIWNGSVWTFVDPTTTPAVLPVPEPTTLLAGVLLLLPFGVSTFRILRRQRMP